MVRSGPVHSGKKGFIVIQGTKRLQKIIIDRILIQGCRVVAQQMMWEIGPADEGGEKVGAHLMRTQNALHPFDDVLDLIPALFQ